MADLSANAPLRFYSARLKHSEKWVLDNSAAQTIYKGHPMILDRSEDEVYPRGFLDATTVDSADIFIGIAAEDKAVATGDTETDNEILIWIAPTIIGFKSAVFTDADVGDQVFMSDSSTLSATTTSNPEIGKIHRVVDGYCYVQLVTPFICANV